MAMMVHAGDYSTEKGWLEAWGFSADPFASRKADEELDLIDKYFAPDRKFDEIKGVYNDAQPTLFFAQRGCGKSAYRLMISSVCLNAPSYLGAPPEQPVVPVSLTDFERAIAAVPQGPEAVLAEHIKAILHSMIEALLETLREKPAVAVVAVHAAPSYVYPALRWYCDTYSQNYSISTHNYGWQQLVDRATGHFRLVLQRLQHAMPDNSLAKLQQEPRRLLAELSAIIKQMGCSGVYVLVDRLDEFAATVDNPEMALQVILPLLSSSKLLEDSGVVFKFFLTEELYREIISHPEHRSKIRMDRWHLPIVITAEDWTIGRLVEVLDLRVWCFHRQLEKFAQISEVPDAAEQLAQEGEACPRNVIIMANYALEHCSRRAEGRPLPVNQGDINYAIDSFAAIPRPQRGVSPTPQAALRSSSLVEQIYVSMRDVQVEIEENDTTVTLKSDDRKVEITLTPIQANLLTYLRDRRGKVCLYDNLIEAGWPDQDPGGVQNSTLTAQIQRLREKVEPWLNIETVRGRGYKLL